MTTWFVDDPYFILGEDLDLDNLKHHHNDNRDIIHTKDDHGNLKSSEKDSPFIVYVSACLAALGGLLFGYDMGKKPST